MLRIFGGKHAGGWRRPTVAVLLLAVGTWLTVVWPPDELRFQWEPLNVMISFGVIALPFYALALGVTVKGRWFPYLSTLILILLAFIYLMSAPFMLFAAAAGNHQPLERLAGDGYDIVLYRTNCGAPCSFGVLIRQECRVMPGIIREKFVREWYPAYEARITVVGPDSIRVQVPEYGDRGPRTADDRVIALEPRPCDISFDAPAS